MPDVFEPIYPPTVCETDPREVLTDVEQEMYDHVLKHFSEAAYMIPEVENGVLTEAEKFWLSRECLLRYVIFPQHPICISTLSSLLGIFVPRNGRLLHQPSTGWKRRSNGEENMVYTIW